MLSILSARLAGVKRRLRGFATEADGLAAVEFALVLPVMILLYFGMVEISVALMVDRKVVTVARSVADLTGQATELSTAEMGGIFGAGATILAPYDASKLTVRVSSVVVRKSGSSVQATVCWSQRWDGSAQGAGYAEGHVISPIPPGFNVEGTSFILAEIENPYVPMLGTAIFEGGKVQLGEVAAWPVRNSPQVKFNGKECSLT